MLTNCWSLLPIDIIYTFPDNNTFLIGKDGYTPSLYNSTFCYSLKWILLNLLESCTIDKYFLICDRILWWDLWDIEYSGNDWNNRKIYLLCPWSIYYSEYYYYMPPEGRYWLHVLFDGFDWILLLKKNIHKKIIRLLRYHCMYYVCLWVNNAIFMINRYIRNIIIKIFQLNWNTMN